MALTSVIWPSISHSTHLPIVLAPFHHIVFAWCCRLLPISGCIIFVWLLAGTLFYKYVCTFTVPTHLFSKALRNSCTNSHRPCPPPPRVCGRYNAKFRSSQAFYFTVQSGFSVGFGVKGVMANDAADPELARWCVREAAAPARCIDVLYSTSSHVNPTETHYVMFAQQRT